MYRCVCDWLGLPYKEEVQWVSIMTVINRIKPLMIITATYITIFLISLCVSRFFLKLLLLVHNEIIRSLLYMFPLLCEIACFYITHQELADFLCVCVCVLTLALIN